MVSPTPLRPPGLKKSPHFLRVCGGCGYMIAMWLIVGFMVVGGRWGRKGGSSNFSRPMSRPRVALKKIINHARAKLEFRQTRRRWNVSRAKQNTYGGPSGRTRSILPSRQKKILTDSLDNFHAPRRQKYKLLFDPMIPKLPNPPPPFSLFLPSIIMERSADLRNLPNF